MLKWLKINICVFTRVKAWPAWSGGVQMKNVHIVLVVKKTHFILHF